jgi:2-(1,2-epoxy-1,2-dihydrophenyl)acetyl-CoA isomerase
MSELVLVDRGAGFRTLSLNRPDKLNAIDDGLTEALRAAIADAEADPACRALVLTGAGRGFCAGADLEATLGQDLGDVLERGFNPIIRTIRSLRMPVVCAVNGVAAGAGANIALACDIVLAGRSARFIQAFVKIGLIPDAGGTWLLPRLAGDARARGMAMLGGTVMAEQALAWGMIWQVVDDAALVAEAQKLAAHLATQPTAAMARMKQLFAVSGTHTLEQQLDAERDMQRVSGQGADFAEGVQAFLEKRPAKFTGR